MTLAEKLAALEPRDERERALVALAREAYLLWKLSLDREAMGGPAWWLTHEEVGVMLRAVHAALPAQEDKPC